MTMLPTKRRKMEYLPMDYTPLPTDILCGRGRSFCKHFGNQKFSEIVRNNVQRYRSGQDRSERRELVESILEHIFQQGYRFLKQDTKTQQFYELDAEAAHEKTGHAIRDLIKMMKNSPGSITYPSSMGISSNQPLVSFDATPEDTTAKEIKLDKKLADLIDHLEKEQNSLSRLIAAASSSNKKHDRGGTWKEAEEHDLVTRSLLPYPETYSSKMHFSGPRMDPLLAHGTGAASGKIAMDTFYSNEKLSQIQLPISSQLPGIQSDWTSLLPPPPVDSIVSMPEFKSFHQQHHDPPVIQLSTAARKSATSSSHGGYTATATDSSSVYAALDQFDHDLDQIFDTTLN